MNVIDLEILIPASPEFIWRFLGDPAALSQWQEDVNSVSFLSTQREGRGTRWRASSDNNSDIVVEVSAWYDTLGYEYSLMDGTSFSENTGRIRLHEVPDGTLVRWTFQYELGGVLGGLRNAMRIKRSTTSQIQASLRNLHQLILQESGGIPTHEAKASVREAPDVGERLAYKPRHPSAFNDPALDESAAREIEPDTDKQPAIYDYEFELESVPARVDTDTKPNPVVLAPDYAYEMEAEPDVLLDDTKPMEAEALFTESPIPPPRQPDPAMSNFEAAPPPAALERTRLEPQETRDSAHLSVFEIFGLQKPSDARNQPAAPLEPDRDADMRSLRSPVLAQVEPRAIDKPPDLVSQAPATEWPAGTITGLRRRSRRRSTSLRAHS